MGLRTWLMEIPLVYDLFQNGLERPIFRKWLTEEIICTNDGMRVLDVGCGTASIRSLLSNVTYIGIDHNPKYSAKARLIHGENGDFRNLDVTDAKFRELQKFDRILLLRVLHHLNDSECTKLMAALGEVLRDNGHLITLDNALVRGSTQSREFSRSWIVVVMPEPHSNIDLSSKLPLWWSPKSFGMTCYASPTRLQPFVPWQSNLSLHGY